MRGGVCKRGSQYSRGCFFGPSSLPLAAWRAFIVGRAPALAPIGWSCCGQSPRRSGRWMRAPRRGMAAAGGAGDDHLTTQLHQKVPTQTDGRGSSRNARVAAVLSGPGFPAVMVCLIAAGFVVSLVTETAELHGAGRGGDSGVSGDPAASGRLVSVSPGVTRHGHLQCLGWQGQSLTPVPCPPAPP